MLTGVSIWVRSTVVFLKSELRPVAHADWRVYVGQVNCGVPEIRTEASGSC